MNVLFETTNKSQISLIKTLVTDNIQITLDALGSVFTCVATLFKSKFEAIELYADNSRIAIILI